MAAETEARVSPDVLAFLDDLRPETRSFLSDLRPEEVSMLRDGIRLVAAVSTVGRAVRLGIILGAGVVLGVSGVGEAAVKIWHWIIPPLGPKP